jgi:hypothetical protein
MGKDGISMISFARGVINGYCMAQPTGSTLREAANEFETSTSAEASMAALGKIAVEPYLSAHAKVVMAEILARTAAVPRCPECGSYLAAADPFGEIFVCVRCSKDAKIVSLGQINMGMVR